MIPEKYKTLYRSYKTIQREGKRFRHHADAVDVNEEINAIKTEVERVGFFVIENFFSPEECRDLREEIDRQIHNYRDQIYVDPVGADHRIYGANKISEEIDVFYRHPLIEGLRGALYQRREEKVPGFTMAAKMVAAEKNLGSGQGWHRDSVYERQYKTIVYLSDVNDDNGPFQYIEGTQNPKTIMEFIRKFNFEYYHHRLTEAEVANILKLKKYTLHSLTAKQGTLIVVDTCGIHRGKPIEKGTRYALTNYSWIDRIPEHIAKQLVTKPTS